MDPNETLREMLKLAHKSENENLSSEDADRLGELVLALDRWLGMGGFPPERWYPNEKAAIADRLSGYAHGNMVEVVIFTADGCDEHTVSDVIINGPCIQINVEGEEYVTKAKADG